MSTDDLQQRWSAALMKNYGTPKVALVRGAGAVVYDADGKRYLDFLGGIAVNTGSQRSGRHHLLIRIPIRNTTSSPSYSWVIRPASLSVMVSPLLHG